MWSRVHPYLFILLFLIFVSCKDVQGSHENVTYEQATEICKDKGNLVLPLSLDEQFALASKLKNKSIWINLQKAKSKLAWLDKSELELEVDYAPDRTCGCLGKDSDDMLTCHCSDKAAATLCRLKAYGQVCDGMTSPYHGLYATPDCFVILPGYTDWFTASTKCTAIGANLAVFRSKFQYHELVQNIRTEETSQVRYYWIGFRMSDWITLNDGYQSTVNVGFWAAKSPDPEDINKTCAVMIKTFWIPVECNERHHVECQNDFMIRPGITNAYTKAPPLQSECMEKDCGGFKNAFFIVLSVSLAIIILFLVVMCWRKRRSEYKGIGWSQKCWCKIL